MNVFTFIEYLTILDLTDEPVLTEDIVKKQYRVLSKVFHPDLCNEAFRDGDHFARMTQAKDWLLSNLSLANDMIESQCGIGDLTVERVVQRVRNERRMREEAAQREREEQIRRTAEEIHAATSAVREEKPEPERQTPRPRKQKVENDDPLQKIRVFLRILNILCMLLIVLTGAPVLFGDGNIWMVLGLVVAVAYLIFYIAVIDRSPHKRK